MVASFLVFEPAPAAAPKFPRHLSLDGLVCRPTHLCGWQPMQEQRRYAKRAGVSRGRGVLVSRIQKNFLESF